MDMPVKHKTTRVSTDKGQEPSEKSGGFVLLGRIIKHEHCGRIPWLLALWDLLAAAPKHRTHLHTATLAQNKNPRAASNLVITEHQAYN